MALLIILSIFDWNVWQILVLDGLLHPHSSTPYVQMGRNIALYTVSLLSRDSCEGAFISQLVYRGSLRSVNSLFAEKAIRKYDKKRGKEKGGFASGWPVVSLISAGVERN